MVNGLPSVINMTSKQRQLGECGRIYPTCGHTCGSFLIPGDVHVCPSHCQHWCVLPSLQILDQSGPTFMVFQCNEPGGEFNVEGQTNQTSSLESPYPAIPFPNQVIDEQGLTRLLANLNPFENQFGLGTLTLVRSPEAMKLVQGPKSLTIVKAPNSLTPAQTPPPNELNTSSNPGSSNSQHRVHLDVNCNPTTSTMFNAERSMMIVERVFQPLNICEQWRGQQGQRPPSTAHADGVLVLDLEDLWRMGFIRCSQGHLHGGDDEKCPTCGEVNRFLRY